MKFSLAATQCVEAGVSPAKGVSPRAAQSAVNLLTTNVFAGVIFPISGLRSKKAELLIAILGLLSGDEGEKMPRKRLSEEKVIYALKHLEAGAKRMEVCRELGLSEQTLYNWKRKYKGMGVGELRRLREQEVERIGGGSDPGQAYPAGGAL